MKALLFGTTLLACAVPAFAQIETTGHPCQTDTVLNGVPTLVVIVPAPSLRQRAHTGSFRPPAPGGSDSGANTGLMSGIGSIGTLSIGTSGVGTINRSGIGNIGRSGVGNIGTSGLGTLPAPPPSSSPFSVPMTPVPAPGLRNAIAPPLAVAPPLFFTTCR